ncbi:MAG: hypothetical protein IH946_07215 [Bacteroidetes bacterium]|nr:hypothetical protein [Bacteroidota bacterium]
MLRTLLISIISLQLVTVAAQTVKQAHGYADSLLAARGYTTALKEYRRVVFFGNDEYKKLAYPHIAECYLYKGEYKKAISYYDLAFNTQSNDSLRKEYILKKSLCYTLNKDYTLALGEIFGLKTNKSDHFEKRKNFHLGILYFQTAEYEKAKEHIKVSVDTTDRVLAVRIDSIFKANRKIERLKPGVAQVLSLILPGLGQIYAGEIGKALNSLILTGGLAVLFVYTASTYSILDAILGVFPWYQRYYIGGSTHAGDMVRLKKKVRREKVYNRLIQTLQ